MRVLNAVVFLAALISASAALPKRAAVKALDSVPTNGRASAILEKRQIAAVSAAKCAVHKPSRGGAAAAVLEFPPAIKLLIGVGGIYASFMYYGVLQEGVFSYQASDGAGFKQVWFLMVLESLANVIVGFLGMKANGATVGLPLKLFAFSGATQVLAKAATNLALRFGVSFPVVTLAKSGKMVPVMLGSILLGGATYSLREYGQVLMIIGGTCLVSMAKKAKPGGKASSATGLAMVLLSLSCDGLTGGLQKRIKGEAAARGVKAKPYDFMFWTNWFMLWTALVVAGAGGELGKGVAFCSENPVILNKIGRFALCSAVGQSFIFYTISNFEPLVCSTVTTTRKIFSVLLSIFLNNHKLNAQGWAGISVACLGILGELEDKYSKSQKQPKPLSVPAPPPSPPIPAPEESTSEATPESAPE